MLEIELIDNLGDYWRLISPGVIKQNKHGMWVTWWYVGEGPVPLTTMYIRIPLPLFTEWWNV